jgi:TonB family protein
MLAAAFKRHEVVRILVAAGANPEAQDELGFNAVDWAKSDAEVINLLTHFEPVKPKVAAPVPEPVVSPVPPRIVEQSVPRFAEESTLKGLAGAILRDHKPRLEEHVQPIGSLPPAVPASTPKPEPVAPPIPDDDTLDKPARELTEDTAAPRSSSKSRARIFDLNAASEPPKPLSKVEVSVPQPSPRRRGLVFLWLFVIMVLAGISFGVYRLGKSLTRQSTTTIEASLPKPEAQPPITIPKSAPVLGGDVIGAELYLPDAAYPTEAQGRSGTVKVEIQVSQKGIVFEAKAVDGDEVFKAAAEKAATGSAFSPDKLKNKSKVVEGTITYSFTQIQPAPNKNTSAGVTAVAGGPLSGAARNLVEPDYPESAKQAGASGEFTIVVRVDRSGKVMSWRPLNGDERLRESVIKAAKRSTFSPAKLPGNDEVVGTITYTFR